MIQLLTPGLHTTIFQLIALHSDDRGTLMSTHRLVVHVESAVRLLYTTAPAMGVFTIFVSCAANLSTIIKAAPLTGVIDHNLFV